MAKQQKAMYILVTVLIYAFLAVMAIIIVFPFYWMIISSVKSLNEYNLNVPTLWPKEFHFENYIRSYELANLGRSFINTVIVGVSSTLLSLVITVLTAFAFSRLEFKGRDLIFSLLMATMMVPGELFTITNYQTVSTMGITNTYTVLIVPFFIF